MPRAFIRAWFIFRAIIRRWFSPITAYRRRFAGDSRQYSLRFGDIAFQGSALPLRLPCLLDTGRTAALSFLVLPMISGGRYFPLPLAHADAAALIILAALPLDIADSRCLIDLRRLAYSPIYADVVAPSHYLVPRANSLLARFDDEIFAASAASPRRRGSSPHTARVRA